MIVWTCSSHKSPFNICMCVDSTIVTDVMYHIVSSGCNFCDRTAFILISQWASYTSPYAHHRKRNWESDNRDISYSCELLFIISFNAAIATVVLACLADFAGGFSSFADLDGIVSSLRIDRFCATVPCCVAPMVKQWLHLGQDIISESRAGSSGAINSSSSSLVCFLFIICRWRCSCSCKDIQHLLAGLDAADCVSDRRLFVAGWREEDFLDPDAAGIALLPHSCLLRNGFQLECNAMGS